MKKIIKKIFGLNKNNKIKRVELDFLVSDNQIDNVLNDMDYKRLFYTLNNYLLKINKEGKLTELRKKIKSDFAISIMIDNDNTVYYKISNTTIIFKYKIFALTNNKREKYYFDISTKGHKLTWKKDERYLKEIFRLKELHSIILNEYKSL